jgi:predicted HAD superfamily Cof-like phosphohydrolase
MSLVNNILSASCEDCSCYEDPKESRDASKKLSLMKNVQEILGNETTSPVITETNLREEVIPYIEKGILTICESVRGSKTHTLLVKDFTEQSMGVKLPNKPTKMSRNEVKFIVRMVISEMMELCSTVTPTVRDALDLFDECVETTDNPKLFDPASKSDVEIMAEQYDSFVDAWYYMLNTAVKKGVDLDGIFRIVHGANMAKRFPDGTFHRREDGKVVKPDGWKEPDIVGEIQRQLI